MDDTPRSDGSRRHDRRRFATGVGLLAAVVLPLGVVLAGSSGAVHAVGLAALASGIGLAVAGVSLALGHNPLARRRRDD